MENQSANRDALVSVALGTIVTLVAAASVINLLFPSPALIPLPINPASESSQITTN